MGRKTLRKPNRNDTMRPSYFFIVALAAGVIMLAVMAVLFIRNPPKPEQPRTRTAITADYVQRPA